MSFKKFISNKIIAGAIAFFIACLLLWLPVVLIAGAVGIDGTGLEDYDLLSRLVRGFKPIIHLIVGVVWGLIFWVIYYFLRRFKK